jgi:excisionase family DNA binding protein
VTFKRAAAAECCATDDKPRRKSAIDVNRTKYLSLSDFARYAGMSRTTAWKLAKSGRLRVFRIGPRLVRVPTSEIVRMGRQSAIGPPDTS